MNYEFFFLQGAKTRPKVLRVLAPTQHEAKAIVARRFGWIPSDEKETADKFLHSIRIRLATVQLVTKTSERSERREAG